MQKVPDLRPLVELDVFAQADIAPATELRDLGKGILRIDIFHLQAGAALDDDIAAADGLDADKADLLIILPRGKIQRVGVLRIRRQIVAENDLRFDWAEHLPQNAVRPVADAGFAQGAIQANLKEICRGVLVFKQLRRPRRAHGMRGRRAFSDLINISDRFHWYTSQLTVAFSFQKHGYYTKFKL